MLVAVAQINPTVGDFDGNIRLIGEGIDRARQAGARLVVFPQMAVCGCPARDFLRRQAFLDAVEAGLARIRTQTDGIGVLLGAPLRREGRLHNAAVLLWDRKLVGFAAGRGQCNAGVFDEGRYFTPGTDPRLLDCCGLRLGVMVGDCDHPLQIPDAGVDLIIHMAASPYHRGRPRRRLKQAAAMASLNRSPFLYVNQWGGNDELVFDGASFLLNARGKPVLRCKEFESDFMVFGVGTVADMPAVGPPRSDGPARVYRALVLGLSDYFRKTGFSKALIGLSGGIDSAVAAALAAAALGAENVRGVNMPSRYSSESGMEDARELAARLGIGFELRPIESHFRSFIEEFNPDGAPLLDVAEENIQARIRGDILMFLANREGRLVLNAGNKSEAAIGYTTLYGDMAAALGVLADVPKTLVYELAAYINREEELIPDSIIRRPPSAELAPGQLDESSLPPYSVLDGILEAYIEEGCSPAEIVVRGYDKALTRHIIRLVERAEHKRRQAAPGLRVTAVAFGSGRRFPIAHRWVP